MLKLQTAIPASRGIFVSCLTVGLSVFLSVNVSETKRAKATQQSYVLSQQNYCLPLPLIYFYVHGVFLSAKLVLCNFINMCSVLPLDLTLCFCQSFYWRLSLCMYSYVSLFALVPMWLHTSFCILLYVWSGVAA